MHQPATQAATVRFFGEPHALLGRGQQAILFTNGREPGAENRIERFARMPWPANMKRIVVDVQTAPRVVAWFGIHEFPTVAIVCDGAILSLEDSCDESVCLRLLSVAARRHPACLEDSWNRLQDD